MCSDILCFLVSSSHCSYFPIISFPFLRRLATGGLGRGRTGPTRAANETRARRGEAKSTCHLVCSLYSIHFFFSFFFFSNRLQCNNTQGGTGRGGDGQDVMGPTRAGTTTRDSNEGQGRGQVGRKKRVTGELEF